MTHTTALSITEGLDQYVQWSVFSFVRAASWVVSTLFEGLWTTDHRCSRSISMVMGGHSLVGWYALPVMSVATGPTLTRNVDHTGTEIRVVMARATMVLVECPP